MKSDFRFLPLNLKNKKSLSLKLLIVILILITSTIILIVLADYFIKNIFIDPRWTTFYFRLTLFAYCSIVAALLIYMFFTTVRPLSSCESLLFGQYLESQKSNNLFLKQNASLNEVIEAVINHQQESWNRELTANFLRQQAELSQLQSQINPHFLYNTLESIRGFALMKDVPEIAQMTEALSSMFRNNTRNIGNSVSLAYEIKNVENYILIQQFRFSGRFTFKKNIASENSGILQCKIPPLTIQPIVENAIYHGLETSLEKEEITLWAYLTHKRLVIKVSDNGCGISPATLNKISKSLYEGTQTSQKMTEQYEKHSGIALSNINQRIKMQYGNQYGITVSSTLNVGTEVEITLPCMWT